MSRETAEKILAQIKTSAPSLKRIGLQDYGEPFLSPNLFEIISKIEEDFPQTRINLTTNGTLINDSHIGQLAKCKNVDLTFSLDAANQQTYEIMRPGSSFTKVVENIKKVLAFRKSQNIVTPRISIHFVITRSNFQDIPRYIEMGEELGVDSIGFVHPFGLFRSDLNEPVFSIDQRLSEYGNAFLLMKNEIESAKPLLMEKCHIPDISPDGLRADCSFNGRSTLVIDVEGNAFPCCVIAAKYHEPDSNVHEMGNVHTRSLQDIWNSEQFRGFREGFFKGLIPHPVCAKCSKYYWI